MVGLIITLIVTLLISILWVKGLSDMKENHPNYKGEEFLNWDRKNDDWDDNKNHTEGEI